MSYCRFSTDDFQCDVYCYEDVYGGFTTHVAVRRSIIDRSSLPPKVPLSKDTVDQYLERHQKLMELLKDCEREPIGLPYDGQSFNDPTPLEAAERLEMLQEAGYNVPQYAIDALREEALTWKEASDKPLPENY